MCGRFTLKTPVIDWLMSLFPQHGDSLRNIARNLSAAHPRLVQPRFNIAPSQLIWVVTQPFDGEHSRAIPETETIRCMRWGLVPAWADSPNVAYSMINARSETLFEKPSFKNLLPEHRCIVVADGYYEWLRSSAPASKQPYWIHRPQDQPFAMAGLWTENRRIDPSTVLQSATIVTTQANEDTRSVHDRMPVVLPDIEGISRWLAHKTEVTPLQELLRPVHPGFFQIRCVSTQVNNARHEGPGLIESIPTL